MTINSKHPNYKIKQFEFKPKTTQEDIDLIKSMKADSKTIHQIRYALLQRHTDPITKKIDVSMTTINRWADKY